MDDAEDLNRTKAEIFHAKNLVELAEAKLRLAEAKQMVILKQRVVSIEEHMLGKTDE